MKKKYKPDNIIPCECGGNGFLEENLTRYDPAWYFKNEWFVKCVKCGKEGERTRLNQKVAVCLWNKFVESLK